MGGNDSSEGQLYVWYRGEWGTVCDDFFTDTAASLACLQLGFTGGGDALHGAPWGAGSGPIWMDDVQVLLC